MIQRGRNLKLSWPKSKLLEVMKYVGMGAIIQAAFIFTRFKLVNFLLQEK
jgi:hypothetical protein